MYKNSLVVAIKHNNKVLRERGGKVTLPFDVEYSIFIKNLNSKKASVNISIDGEDVLDNKSILIEANSNMELDGFMKGMSAKNRFRFIKKTKQISEYRGDKADDGLIRVEFAYEKVNDWFYFEPIRYNQPIKYGNSDDSFTCMYTSNTSNNINDVINCKSLSSIQPEIEEGITVKGGMIDQNFEYGHIGELERPQVIIIHLCGEKSNGTVVAKPVMVKTRLRCKTCGIWSKSNVNFCSNCGTFLE